MPNFQGDEAHNYDSRITKLVPGYELLHQLTAAQLNTILPDDAVILVVGAGTGKDIIELAKYNDTWHFIAQDISQDMLDIAKKNFVNSELASRVTFYQGPIKTLDTPVDAALCLLVTHFIPKLEEKRRLLQSIRRNLIYKGTLFLADLMVAETKFERESQLTTCRALGLSEIGEQRMRHNLTHEFFPLTHSNLTDLLNQTAFSKPAFYFKALGFSGISCQAL